SDPLNEYWQSQEVRCTPADTLKGERLDSFTFRQDYREKDHGTGTNDTVLRPKTKVLLFYAREAGRRQAKTVFWVNLTKPDPKLATHAPYNNDCKWIEDGKAVVTFVKARIANENPQDRTKKRGVIVPFTAYEAGDMYWDFVRTADPEYKQTLIKQLRDG